MRQLAWKAALGTSLVVGLLALLPGRVGVGDTPLSFLMVSYLAVTTFMIIGVVFVLFGHKMDQTVQEMLKRLSGIDQQENPQTATAPEWLSGGVTLFDTACSDQSLKILELQTSLRASEISQRVAEAERNHLEHILHSLRDAVIVTDGFDDVVLANESASQLFGFDIDKSINNPLNQTVNDPGIVKFVQETRESANLKSRRMVEHELATKPDPRILEVALSCIPNQSQQAGGVVTILHDITRERQISAMKTDFVSKASHELRTPLSLIKAYIEMLIDGEAEDEESRNEFYTIIQTETNRLERLINNMLNISRIESGISQGEWQDCDVKDVIDEVVDLAQPRAADKNITITHKRGQLCTVAEVDRDMIQQVVMNLVSNAVKYTPDGGRVTLSSALSDCDRSILVSVADTGLGIPPDAIPHLFDKFYRIKNYNRIAPGTGLGLNLVKQVVEKIHGGEVGIDSELGMGSKFWFTVPCRRAA